MLLAGFGHAGWEWHPFAAERRYVDDLISKGQLVRLDQITYPLLLREPVPMSYKMSRAAYASMFGPTTGDKVRLADTELFIEVEKDFTTYGDEVKFGGGKVIRDGMGQSQATRAEGAVDTVITNALIVDHWGIVKADIGLKDGRIAAIGKAGNPDTQPGVDHHRRPLHGGDCRRRARSSRPAAWTRISTSSARSRSRRP